MFKKLTASVISAAVFIFVTATTAFADGKGKSSFFDFYMNLFGKGKAGSYILVGIAFLIFGLLIGYAIGLKCFKNDVTDADDKTEEETK